MIILRNINRGVYLKDHFKTLLVDLYNPASIYNEPLLCWGCVVNPGKNLVLNPPESFRILSNKIEFRKLVSNHGVRIPATFFDKPSAQAFMGNIKDVDLGKRWLIGRPAHHRGGKNLEILKTVDEVAHSQSSYWTEYIPKTREIRVFVAFGKVWCVAEKLVDDKDQVAWNVEQGGVFDILRWGNWPSKACWYAVKSAEVSGVHVASFDLIYYDGYWYMLEGNSSTKITGDYKIELLKRIFKYHEESNSYVIAPAGDYVKDYKRYIHPAL